MIGLTGYDGFIGRHFLRKQPQALLMDDRTLLPQDSLEAVVHLAAVSDTTSTHKRQLEDSNFFFPRTLWRHCYDLKIPFIYASSAAVYGDGKNGFIEEPTSDWTREWKPLNLYAQSKKRFDQWALSRWEQTNLHPPRWYGLRFFNVYGAMENNKGHMASQVYQQLMRVRKGGVPTFFEGTASMSRDFIYVEDVVNVIMHFVKATRAPSGIYNVGSGIARTFHELGTIVNRQEKGSSTAAIHYTIPMPSGLLESYQRHTRAPIGKLKLTGYNEPMTSLEDGIRLTSEELKREL